MRPVRRRCALADDARSTDKRSGRNNNLSLGIDSSGVSWFTRARVRAARARAERGCASGAIISFEGRLVNGEIYEQMRHAERKATQIGGVKCLFVALYDPAVRGEYGRRQTSHSTGRDRPVS